MKKKLLVYISIVVIAALGYSFYYFNQYEIEDNDVAIQSSLETWLNRPNEIGMYPKILKIEQVGDTTSHIILFQLTNDDLNGQMEGELTSILLNSPDIVARTLAELLES